MNRLGYSVAAEQFIKDLTCMTGTSASSYLCPLCIQEVAPEDMSKDEFPPQSLGGRQWVPTCRSCNSTAGHSFESRAAEFRHRTDFVRKTGLLPEILAIDSTTLRVSVDRTQTPPVVTARDGQDQITRKVADRLAGSEASRAGAILKPDPRRRIDQRGMETTFVKAAYLAVFHALGYRGILNPAYNHVRDYIRSRGESGLPPCMPMWPRRHFGEPRVSVGIIASPERAQALFVKFVGFTTAFIRDQAVTDADLWVLQPLPSDEDLRKYRIAVGTMDHLEQCALFDLPPDLKVRDGVPLELDYGDGSTIRLNAEFHYAEV